MGSDAHYAEEAPVRAVVVDAFRIERSPVTNADFARFVRDTGYLTLAERVPDAALYPGADATDLQPGSAVFMQHGAEAEPRGPVQWWAFVPGACWRWPQGPDRAPCRADHPVVHVAFEDARAYAAWKGRSLPSEAQWEYAARGGLDRRTYAWGDEFMPGGRPLANTWPGQFPHQRDPDYAFERTSPVGAFPPNGFGLLDMIGNVWEWTADYYTTAVAATSGCCAAIDPRHDDAAAREASRHPSSGFPRRVLKGGSHLCAPNYCRRYRPAARHAHEEDTSTSHIGFRCVAS